MDCVNFKTGLKAVAWYEGISEDEAKFKLWTLGPIGATYLARWKEAWEKAQENPAESNWQEAKNQWQDWQNLGLNPLNIKSE